MYTGTHADYVAAVAQSCTSMYTRLATHRPVVALRTHLQPRLHDLTSTTMVAYNIKSTSVAMLHAVIAPRDDAIRICQYTKIILKTIYCPLLIKSLDHEGWVVGASAGTDTAFG